MNKQLLLSAAGVMAWLLIQSPAEAQRGGRGGGGRVGGARPAPSFGGGARPNYSRPSATSFSRPSNLPQARPGGGNFGMPSTRPSPGGGFSANRPTPLPGGGGAGGLPNRPSGGGGIGGGAGGLPNRPGGGSGILPDRPGGGGIGGGAGFPNRPGGGVLPDRPGGGGNLPNRPGGGGENRPDWNRPDRPNWDNNNININNNWTNNINNWNRPGWNGWNSYYRGWYNGWHAGYWSGWATNPGIWAGAGVGYGLGWLAAPGTTYVYSNPYYVPVPTTVTPAVNYSQPIPPPPAPPPAAEGSGQPQDDRPAAPRDDNEKQAAQLFEQARDAFKAENYDQALDLITKAIDRIPSDAIMHEFRGLVLFAQKKYQDAAAAIYAVLSVGPGWNWDTMKSLYRSVDTYTAQLRALEEFQARNPNESYASFLLAYHYLVLDYRDAAIKQLQNVVRVNPKDQLAQDLLRALTQKPSSADKPSPGGS